FHRVRFECARSAEPPISSGSSGAKVSMAICEALREAMVWPSACCLAIYASAWATKSAGSSPAMRR
ncbi:hypothetical protein RNS24_12790, partial [Staphylococcus pseudintermedius]